MAISRAILLSTSTRPRISLSSSSYLTQSSTLSSSDQTPQDETLISSVVSILKEQRSKSRWNYIKTVYPNGFSSKQVSDIIIQLRNNPRLALRFFIWSEKKSLCNHDLLSYSTVIHILARARLKTLAQTLIQKAIRVSESDTFEEDPDNHSSNPPKIFETLTKTYRACDSAPFVFDLLIRACLETKKIDSSITIVGMLRSRSIYPKASTCNSLIRLVAKLRGANEGFAIYEEIFSRDEGEGKKTRARVSPNVQTFNTLMLCFHQEGKTQRVEEIWAEMEKLEISPNMFSYSILMAAFCEEGKTVKAMNLWEEMKMKQIEPDVMAYNTLIKGFCDEGEIERAEELFREMELGKIEGTCVTYEILIKGYCKNGGLDSALLLFKEMSRKEFKPEASTVDEVIREMCSNNLVIEGWKFFKDVMKRKDFFPSVKSYKFLIKGLCEEGKMDEALILQAEMIGKGYEPSSEIYSDFINGYSKLGDEEKARKLRKEMVEIGLQLEED